MGKFRLGLMLLVAIMAISPVASGFAQQEDHLRVTDQMLDDFGAVVEAERGNFHIPGVAVAVIQDGTVRYAQGFGVRDVATGEPFTPETRFRIGSTTKSMTSLLVAQAVDEGKLTWDTPVTEILPAFKTSVPELTARITVGDLMGMGTGLISDDIRSLDWGIWTVDDLLAAVADQVAAGTYREDYAYNNEVYALGGYAAVAANGQDLTLANYAALLQTRLFDPAGMSSAILTDDLSQLGGDYARSYEFTLGNTLDTPSLALPAPLNVAGPAGGVWVNLDDMARYLVTQMNGGVTPDGTRIVSAENLAETWKSGVRSQPDEDDTHDVFYAMGWVNMVFRDVPARFHDGGWEGYRTLMVVLPEANAGLIIFANHTFGDLYNYAMLEVFAEMLYGLEPLALDRWHERFDQTYGTIEEQVAQLPPAVIAPGEVADLLGEYESHWTVEQHDDGTLWLVHGPWQFALQPLPMPYSFVIANSTALGTLIQFGAEGDQINLTLGEGDTTLTVNKLG